MSKSIFEYNITPEEKGRLLADLRVEAQTLLIRKETNKNKHEKAIKFFNSKEFEADERVFPPLVNEKGRRVAIPKNIVDKKRNTMIAQTNQQHAMIEEQLDTRLKEIDTLYQNI